MSHTDRLPHILAVILLISLSFIQILQFKKKQMLHSFTKLLCLLCWYGESTQVTAEIIDPEKLRKYYGIFLNTIAAIARNFRAKIIKNAGDCLIFYFPKTTDSNNKSAFRDVLECCITVISARCTIITNQNLSNRTQSYMKKN